MSQKDMASYIKGMAPKQNDEGDDPTADNASLRTKPTMSASDFVHLVEHGTCDHCTMDAADHAKLKPTLQAMLEHLDARLDDNGEANDTDSGGDEQEQTSADDDDTD